MDMTNWLGHKCIWHNNPLSVTNSSGHFHNVVSKLIFDHWI